MLKAKIKLFLQGLFGFERYLYYFSLFKIRTLKWDSNEKDIFLFIEQLKKKNADSLVLDVGANIGIMTGIIGKTTNYTIHAFEPLPVNYGVLEKIVKKLNLHNRVTLHQIALGFETGFCEMVLPMVQNVKMHGLSHVVDPSITEFNDGIITQKIPMDTLDNVMKSKTISGIKLDVENYEFNVLKGAENILKSQKPIIYTELWDNENRLNCFSFLRGLGYTSYYNKNGQLVPFTENTAPGQTFFFLA